jgi:hypothetical protein
LAWDGEFLKVREDLEVGGAGHHVREGAKMAMICPTPTAQSLTTFENISSHVRGSAQNKKSMSTSLIDILMFQVGTAN